MKSLALREWLSKKTKQEAGLCYLGAAGLFVVGGFVVYVTYWIIYFFIWLFVCSWLDLSNQMVSILSGIVTGLLFVSYFFDDLDSLEEYEFETGPDVRMKVKIAGALGHGWAAGFMGPKTSRSTIRMFASILLIGPGIVATAGRLLQRGRRLRKFDVDNGSRILTALSKAGKGVSFADLFQKYPTMRPQTILEQLRDIDGVVFLSTEPQGLTMTDSLREEIADAAGE